MILRPHLFRSLRSCYAGRVNYSSLPEDLVFCKNGMVVCWHPEPKFPYECSKPLPAKVPEPLSVLKVTEDEAYKLFTVEKPITVIAEECAKLTHTTKHIWFPRSRDKKNIRIEPDRPYL